MKNILLVTIRLLLYVLVILPVLLPFLLVFSAIALISGCMIWVVDNEMECFDMFLFCITIPFVKLREIANQLSAEVNLYSIQRNKGKNRKNSKRSGK